MARDHKPYARNLLRGDLSHRVCFFAALLVGSVLLPSMAFAQTLPDAETMQTLLQGVQRVLSPTAPAEALPTPEEANGPEYRLPLAQIASDEPIEVEQHEGLISMSVRNASLRQVLSALAENQGLNLVIASPVDSPVTAKFDRVPLRSVLESLLSSSGHTWTVKNDIIYVTNIDSGNNLAPDVQGRRVAVIELDFASAADLSPTIAGLLSSIGQSFFTETQSADNRRTKEVLVVEDLSEYVDRIENYIAQVDQPPRQVEIEVRLLEVDLQDDQKFGVNLEALSRVSGAQLSLRSAGLANAAASPGFFIESAGGDLDALLEALISTTDAKTLASPRILAVNGQESRIQIGERIGYRTTTTTETSSLESVAFLDVGVVLVVTPRITRDGRVLMRIAPEVSTGAVNPDTGAPDSETTELQTDALLSTGQGMIIGGLIQERDATSISRVPVLGSLPYVNFLFQRRQVEKKRSELIVAIVPHVLPYEPVRRAREEQDLGRVFDPLTYGPLCRYPRPYEPRIPDPHTEQPRIELLVDRASHCDEACPTLPHASPIQTCPTPDWQCRRLPPTLVVSEPQREFRAPIETATRVTPTSHQTR